MPQQQRLSGEKARLKSTHCGMNGVVPIKTSNPLLHYCMHSDALVPGAMQATNNHDNTY